MFVPPIVEPVETNGGFQSPNGGLQPLYFKKPFDTLKSFVSLEWGARWNYSNIFGTHSSHAHAWWHHLDSSWAGVGCGVGNGWRSQVSHVKGRDPSSLPV